MAGSEVMDIFPLKKRIYVRLYGKLLSENTEMESLPPEKEFAARLGVSRNTLREALKMLENDGILHRVRAVGTSAVAELSRSFSGSYLFCMADKRPSPHVGNAILQGAAAAADALGGRLDFCSTENILKIPFEELRLTLSQSRCRGIVLFLRNFRGDEKITALLKRLELPVVLAYCEKGDREITGFAAVRHCGRESWLEALRYLESSGHRRIVTLTLEKELIRECFSEKEYAGVLAGLGLQVAQNPVLRCAMNDKAIRERLEPLFALPEPPDAILCYSDYWALPVYRILTQMKLRIPEDVSVMGYCGSVDTEFLSPKLTTVAIGYNEVGWMAVKTLVDAASWFGYPGREVPEFSTPYMLQVRESTRLR